MRTIAIGDIHGCYEEMIELLDKCKYDNNKDELIFLGDMVDRGPYPREVVQFAMMFNVKCVKGNHEDKMLRWLEYNDREHKENIKNPISDPSLKRMLEWYSFNEKEIQFLKNLPYRIVFRENWVAVHAGFESNVDFKNQRDDKICRVRYLDDSGKMVLIGNNLEQPPKSYLWTEKYNLPYNVIYGHNVRSKELPLVEMVNGKYLIAMDTGCCFGGNLSAFIFENNTFYFETVSGNNYKKTYGA